MDISSEKKPTPRKKSLLRDLLSDIEPFFYRSAFMYVDAGAHRGDIFREIETSALKPKRSCLIEPNPRSFAALRETVSGLGADRRVSCLNVALSDAPGTLRLSDEDDMSRVSDAPDAGFEVEAARLDDLAETFETDRISLLKIDVEGYELPLLAGAERLLRDQKIDMIYVEAGLNPDSGQQTYYRAIEDVLHGHGYRLFRIYEQKNEWIEDSPLLRRMNMAFMSASFAEANPQRLSRELFDLRAAHADLETRLAGRDRAAETAERRALDLEARLSERDRAAETAERRALDLEARLSERDRAVETARAETADLERRIGEAERDRKKAEDALRALRGEVAESRAELAKLRRYGRALEGKYADILDSTTWRAMEPARRIMRGIRGRRAPAPFVPKLSGGGFAGAGPANPSSATLSATPGREEVDRYVHHLWGGLSAPAVRELTRVLEDDGYDQDLRFEAAHKLATWHAYVDGPDAALAAIRSVDRVAPEHRLSHHRLIKEGFIQLKRGDRDAAQKCFEVLLRRRGHSRARDGVLALANCMTEDAARLAQINRVYEGTKLRGLALRDPSLPLALDNVTGLPDTCETSGQGKVSVIMPAYNAETTIRTALRSLLEQTWRDLEIIVVDDRSTDATHAVVQEMATADPRIVPLRAERNGGPYAARNLGLEIATGDFITTHDSDDWSHPKKIERQVAHLAKNPTVMGVCTYWVRVYADFTISSNWRIGDQTVHWSHSSFLFRREVVERIGGWDPVRVGGDTEYIWRMRSLYGADSFKIIGQRVPMAFALDEESSLTRAKPTHVSTIRFGLRQIYRAVAEYSHARPGGAGPDGKRLRREAAPAEMFAAPEDPAELDFLLMGDCVSPAIISEMRAFIESDKGRGRRTGIFHWPDFEAPGDDLCMEYCELLTRENVSPVLPGTGVRLATRFGVFFGTGHREIDAMPEILDSAATPSRPAVESPVFESAPPSPVLAAPPRVPAAKGRAASDAVFRSGFLVCDSRTLPRSGGVNWPDVRARWTRHDLGGFLLWTDPGAGLLRRNSEKGQAVVIGDAFSVAGRSVADAADELLRTGDWAAIADLGGRFAVLLIEGERCRVAHDPFGSRSVFWRRGGGFAAASHAALLGDAYNHPRDRAVADFMKLRGYRDRTVKYLPGDMTVYDGIHALVPNTAYDSAEGRPRRYWPTLPRRTTTMDRFMSALDQYFDAFVPFVRSRRGPVLFGITGGVDSRGVFAAFLGKGVPIEGVTWTGGYLKPAERPTVDRIVADFGIPHRYLDLDPGADTGIAAAAVVNSGHFRGASKLTASMAMMGLPRDAVFVRGYGGEILRGFYELSSRNPKGLGLPSKRGRRGPSMTPEGLARLYSSSARGFTKEEPYAEACAGFFEGFMERAEYARLEGLGYDLRDIFYWEHRMGMWGASMLNEMDPAVYSLVGLNGREIYETAFGLPDRERLSKALLERVVCRHHAALGAIPYS